MTRDVPVEQIFILILLYPEDTLAPPQLLRLEPGAIEEGEPHVLLPLGSRVKSVWASWLPPVFKLVLPCLSVCLSSSGGIKGEGGGGD